MNLHQRAAARAVCSSMAARRDDTGWTLIGVDSVPLPPEAEDFVETVAGVRFAPLCVVAAVALGIPLPPSWKEDAA